MEAQFHNHFKFIYVKKDQIVPTPGVHLEKTDWEKLIDSLVKQDILRSPNVIKAMRAVQRIQFLPKDLQAYNTTDTPLPIGFGQTISAPHRLSTL
jgi:protein-L-isoaspartate O-methyltransferase